MNYISNVTRAEGDPKVLESGPGSLNSSDRMSRALGWLSIGLGVMQLAAPSRLTRALGMEGNEGLLRAYGAREIVSGILSLSVDKNAGLWGRVAGDGLDIATLMSAWHDSNPKRANVGLALSVVAGLTLLDVASALAVSTQRGRPSGQTRDYSDRAGFPKGIDQARGAARDFVTPPDMRAAPLVAAPLVAAP